MIPCEASDAHLCHQIIRSRPVDEESESAPLISGFLALVKAFICIADVLFRDLSCKKHVYSTSSMKLHCQALARETNSDMHAPSCYSSILEAVKKLRKMQQELPVELSLPSKCLLPAPNLPSRKSVTIKDRQFAIMRVNVHVTSLYLQSTLMDLVLESPIQPTTQTTLPSSTNPMSLETVLCPRCGQLNNGKDLWGFRESLSQQLLNILNVSETDALEANGLSMVSPLSHINFRNIDRNIDRKDQADGSCTARGQYGPVSGTRSRK